MMALTGWASDGALPVKVLSARIAPTAPLVFIVSGDGGWNSFIESVSECFVQKGMPVVCLDSKKYFWSGRTPEKASADINTLISHYMKEWNRKSYILVGYSFGAAVIPFIATRTSSELREKMEGLYSISPDEKTDFEIHLSDMLNLGSSEGKYNVINEMKKIRLLDPVCIFGEEESAAVKKNFSLAGMRVIILKGNHHYNNNYCRLAGAIISSRDAR